MSKYELSKRRIKSKPINTSSSAYHELQNANPTKKKNKNVSIRKNLQLVQGKWC